MLHYNFTDDVELGHAAEAEAPVRLCAHPPGFTNPQHSNTNSRDLSSALGGHTQGLLVRVLQFAAWSVKLK